MQLKHINEKYADFEEAKKFKDGIAILSFLVETSGKDDSQALMVKINFSFSFQNLL